MLYTTRAGNSNICMMANTEQKITLVKSQTHTINANVGPVLASRQLKFGMICITTFHITIVILETCPGVQTAQLKFDFLYIQL
jgi:hypothetical protein